MLARFNDSPSLYKVLKEKQLNINDWSPSKAYHLHEDSEAKQVYMQGLQDIISALKADGGKTVISRRLHTRTSADADEIFRHLCCLYPASAIYLWPDGESYWIGATPELLLNVDNNTVSSVSLAGTVRPVLLVNGMTRT